MFIIIFLLNFLLLCKGESGKFSLTCCHCSQEWMIMVFPLFSFLSFELSGLSVCTGIDVAFFATFMSPHSDNVSGNTSGEEICLHNLSWRCLIHVNEVLKISL